MRDYAELIAGLRDCAKHTCCSAPAVTGVAADTIEELLAVCRDIAAFVIHYADDDEVSAEVLCRKLHKIGVVEKDGAWWALPEPPKEETE